MTKRTQVLVAGDINPAVLAPSMTTTGKAAKAFRLKDGGQDIELYTEDDFLRAIEPGPPADRFDITKLLEDEQGSMSQEEGQDGPFYRPLNHPKGRAKGGERCVKCGQPIGEKSFWIYRDRHVCSDRCNTNLKRQYKRYIVSGSQEAFFPRRDTRGI